jgi:Ser-tRNA(Ala) deacylase AlaX
MATVVSCSPSQLKTVKNGKAETIEGFDIVCNDTILFPEGGGQVRMFH